MPRRRRAVTTPRTILVARTSGPARRRTSPSNRRRDGTLRGTGRHHRRGPIHPAVRADRVASRRRSTAARRSVSRGPWKAPGWPAAPRTGSRPVGRSSIRSGSAGPTTSRPADVPSSGPDSELAGLVGGVAATSAASAADARLAADRAAARAQADADFERVTGSSRSPSAKPGRSVSSTRSHGSPREKPPQREHVQHDGPSWERARRFEAYPQIRNRTGMPALPRIAVLAAALGSPRSCCSSCRPCSASAVMRTRPSRPARRSSRRRRPLSRRPSLTRRRRSTRSRRATRCRRSPRSSA